MQCITIVVLPLVVRVHTLVMGWGYPPKCMNTHNAWGPPISTFIFNDHNPPVTFHASCHSHFQFTFHTHFYRGYDSRQFTLFHVIQFMPFTSTYSIQTCHNHSRTTYRHMPNISHQLSSIHSIHSRSHDFVLKHIKQAYNLMTRANPRARANKQQLTRNLRWVSHLPG